MSFWATNQIPTNFSVQSAVPTGSKQHNEAFIDGSCTMNINGQCLTGGQAIGGMTGYNLASLGGQPTSCLSANIFAAERQPYTVFGWASANNANTLRTYKPGITASMAMRVVAQGR